MDYSRTQANDTLWVPSMREFYEYKEVKKLSVLTKLVSGNTITLYVNQRAVPSTCRWLDMSFTVPPGATPSVTGATYTHNPTTGLLNLFKQKI